MKTTCILYKPPYITPLEAIDLFRIKYPEYQSATLGYAGRLDPLAEGLLLILVNDENKHRKDYERLTKEYTFKALFGISTDSYDYMGMFTAPPFPPPKNPIDDIADILPSFIGRQMHPYPLYSSARVNGKPLYYWARKNRTDITIPTKEIEIFSVSCSHVKSIPISSFAKFASDGVSQVHGEFRQKEIIEQWKNLKQNSTAFFSAEFLITCSSGTYVRGLVHTIGTMLNTGAIAYDIKRTKIGQYTIKDTFFL